MSSDPVLSDSDRALLSARADAFYAAVARSQSSDDWEQFLTGVPDRLRRTVLGEFVIVELGRRWQRGERPLLELYIDRFPELGPLDRVSSKLITEEYRARLRAGDPPDADQYRRRFPVQFPYLESELLAVESEASSKRKSGQFRAVNTLVASDTAEGGATAVPPRATGGGRTPASGTVAASGGASSPRGAGGKRERSGVMGSALRSRTADFTRLKMLGRGMFGEVWLVQSKGTDMRKAMKVMLRTDDDTVRRELRSLDLIKNETNPYLLRTEDYWLDDDKLHVLMELADCTVSNWLAEHNPGLDRREFKKGVPAGELLHVFRETAEVMDELHAKQVMHRDIKPDNILLLNRHAKVADFGLARQQDLAVATQSMMAGSPAYMAPEVWEGKFGGASDLYSLAVTYVELRQGKLPVKLGPMAEIMFAHLEGKFEFSPVMTKEEVKVVRKALAKDPAHRHPTCTAFVEDLVRAINVPLAPPSYARSGTKTGLAALSPVPPPSRSGPDESEIDFGQGRSAPASGTRTHLPPPDEPDRWATQTHISPPPSPPVVSRHRPKPKAKPKRNWIGVVVALLAVLGIVGILAFLLFGGGCNLTPSTGPTGTGTEPTGDGTQPTGDGGTRPTGGPIITPSTKKPDPMPDKKVWTPEGTVADGTATLDLASGRRVPVWVKHTGCGTRFRLINGGADGVQPFYISEGKVRNELVYQTDAEKRPGKALAPAVGRTAAEAVMDITGLFGGADGRLPTPAEWDHAAGFHVRKDEQKTVTQAGGTAWVNAKEPTGTSQDVSEFGLKDMGGNGREWTCGVLTNPEVRYTADTPPKIDPKKDGQFPADAILVVRGRNYSLKSGLTFDQLEAERTTEPQPQLAGRASPYTGFRVVLPIPDR